MMMVVVFILPLEESLGPVECEFGAKVIMNMVNLYPILLFVFHMFVRVDNVYVYTFDAHL